MSTPQPPDFATLDYDRATRCGFPEVILGQGKTTSWTIQAVARLAEAGQSAFVTRLIPETLSALQQTYPTGDGDALARTFFLPQSDWNPPGPQAADVVVVTAGTGDLPVAQEALVTAHVMGCRVEMIVDVGVAGLHRILAKQDRIRQADVVIVVAGMDGALPSVVGGLVDGPVIACPTSIGYGASFGGVAALLTMLNSCASGVGVVNIDAGFNAGVLAARMARRLARARAV